MKKLKVGHGRTLDPKSHRIAHGVATGPNTKKLQYLIDADKEYTGTIKLGAVTASYDGETTEEQPKPWEHITREDVLRVLEKNSPVCSNRFRPFILPSNRTEDRSIWLPVQVKRLK